MGKVALLPLIGLTSLEEPEKEHLAAVEQIKSKVSDERFKKSKYHHQRWWLVLLTPRRGIGR